MKTGLGDSASRSVVPPMEGGALSFGIRENGTVEGLNVETYYQPCVGIITDRERRCLRVFADDGATDIETRVLFSTLETDGWTPPSTGADTERHGSNLPKSAPVPDNGSPKQDDPAPVCAPLSAETEDDALTVAYMVGYAKGKDAALASPAGTAQPTSAAPAGVQPVAWQWRRKGEPWTLEKTFNSEVFATTPDSEVRALYATPPTPASEAAQDAARYRWLREVAMRNGYWPKELNEVLWDSRGTDAEWDAAIDTAIAALRFLPQQPTGERNGD